MTTPATERVAVVLFAHGSRDPAWKRPVEAVADAIRHQIGSQTAAAGRTPAAMVAVTCAYLELTQPDLPTAVAALMADPVEAPQRLRVFPLFLGVGRHAREDLPRLLDDLRATWPQLHVELLPSAGENPQVIELLARIALS